MKVKIGISILLLVIIACSSSSLPPKSSRAVISLATASPLERAEICVAQSVWIRSGAGIEYNELGVLLDGVSVTIQYGKQEYDSYGNLWYFLKVGGKSGFVHSAFVCEVE